MATVTASSASVISRRAYRRRQRRLIRPPIGPAPRAVLRHAGLCARPNQVIDSPEREREGPTAESTGAFEVPAESAREEPGPWRDDLILALLATSLVFGLFLDGWNHINLQNGALGSFFTPWHAALYSGFTATGLWVLFRNRHLFDAEHQPRPYFHTVLGVPLRYPLAMAGLAIATVGLFGDIAWHTAFGQETGVARVIAPFHLLLFTGAALVVSAPLRSALYAPDYYPARSSFRTILPPLLSLTLVTALVAFMFQWLSAFVDWTPSLSIGRIPADLAGNDRIQGTVEFADVARVLVTNLILMAPVVFALRRWRLPFGSVAFLFGAVAVMMSGLSEYDRWGTIVAALAGGLACDALVVWLDVIGTRPFAYRITAGITPIVLWTAYFGVLPTIHDVHWPLDLWLGTVGLAAVTGVLLSFVAVAPAPPKVWGDAPWYGPLGRPRGR